jgi:sugar phosphate isomerase/epimerase
MAQFIISAFADEAGADLSHQIEALKRNGIRYLEIRNVGGGILEKTEEEINAIARQLHDADIQVSSFGSPIGKREIDGDFEEQMKEFRHALRICQILGTKYMRMFSYFVTQDKLEQCRDEVLRRLNAFLDEAQKVGVILCHENESKIYGQNPKEVRDLLESLPRLRGIFDPANYVMNDCDPIEGIEATLPSLEYLHIKDAIMAEKCIVPAGMGDGEVAEVLRRVDASTDKTMFLTVEPHLRIFDAYSRIDSHQLRTGIEFENNDDAFDCAVAHLKTMLTTLGYHEEENKTWKK